jgi:hypothetical protein
MYKDEFNEILNSWEKFLKSLELNMNSSIKKILNKTIENEKVTAIFFEYEYEIMNIGSYAFDKNENIILEEYNILIDELNCKTLFPKEYAVKVDKMWEYRNDIGFSDFMGNFEKKKCEILEKWFLLCWSKIKDEFSNIHKIYFSIHDTALKIDLSTGKKIEYNYLK